jgi:hypothetical protein
MQLKREFKLVIKGTTRKVLRLIVKEIEAVRKGVHRNSLL